MSSAVRDSQAGSVAFDASVSGITPPSMPGRQGAFLSDIIIELGLADGKVVEDAVPAAASTGKPIGRFLLESGVLSEEQLSIAIAERNGLEHVDLDCFDVDPAAATLISRSVAMRYNALPIAFAPDGALVVAVADPSDFLGISDIEVMAKTEVRLAIANPERTQELIEGLPEPPEPLPYVQADSIAALEEVRPADANGDSAGDEAEIAEREEDGDREEIDREELEQLRSQLSQATDERERLGGELERLGQELEQVRGQMNDGDGERERLNQELEQLHSQLSDANDERERLGGELEQVRRQLSDVTDKRDREEIDREELEQLRSQLSDANDERERLSGERERLDQELEQVRGQVNEGDGERERLNQELEQLRRQLSDVTDESEREEIAREELKQLRSQLSDANDERERLSGEHERLGQELEQVRRQLSDVTDKRDREEIDREELEQLRRQLSDVEQAGNEATRSEAEPLDTFAFDQVTLDMKKGTATVRICVEGVVGRLLLTGEGVRNASAAADGVDSATVEVVPTGRKKRKLRKTGRAKVEVSVLFVPASGDPRAQSTAITLMKRKDQ